MKFFKRKPETRRRVFGFLCDHNLTAHVRGIAEIMQVPIYCYAEHLLQLGMKCIRAEMIRDPENINVIIERLREHLVNEHLLVQGLAHEEYNQDLIAGNINYPRQKMEKVKAVFNLVETFEEEGIPDHLVTEELEALSARLFRRNIVEQIKQELDFNMLQQLHVRFPRLIPALMNLLTKYQKEDLSRIFRSPTQSRPRYPKHKSGIS